MGNGGTTPPANGLPRFPPDDVIQVSRCCLPGSWRWRRSGRPLFCCMWSCCSRAVHGSFNGQRGTLRWQRPLASARPFPPSLLPPNARIATTDIVTSPLPRRNLLPLRDYTLDGWAGKLGKETSVSRAPGAVAEPISAWVHLTSLPKEDTRGTPQLMRFPSIA